MDWVKKHVDTVVVLGGILSAVIWMQGKFSSVDQQMNITNTEIHVIKTCFGQLNSEVSKMKSDMERLKSDMEQLKTDMSIMKTVMIMKNIMPQELAANE